MALAQIVSNTYWTCLWVLQEIKLGQNTLLVQGKKPVPWLSHPKTAFVEILPFHETVDFSFPSASYKIHSADSRTLNWTVAASTRLDFNATTCETKSSVNSVLFPVRSGFILTIH